MKAHFDQVNDLIDTNMILDFFGDCIEAAGFTCTMTSWTKYGCYGGNGCGLYYITFRTKETPSHLNPVLCVGIPAASHCDRTMCIGCEFNGVEAFDDCITIAITERIYSENQDYSVRLFIEPNALFFVTDERAKERWTEWIQRHYVCFLSEDLAEFQKALDSAKPKTHICSALD